MKKQLLLHLLDIAYPNNELPVDGDKIANLYKRFQFSASGFTLTDNGKILLNDTIICDLSKSESSLTDALNQVINIEKSIHVKTMNPNNKHLIVVIRELNRRGYMISNIQALTNETYLHFHKN
jgi:hypothetical protein